MTTPDYRKLAAEDDEIFNPEIERDRSKGIEKFGFL